MHLIIALKKRTSRKKKPVLTPAYVPAAEQLNWVIMHGISHRTKTGNRRILIENMRRVSAKVIVA